MTPNNEKEFVRGMFWLGLTILQVVYDSLAAWVNEED